MQEPRRFRRRRREAVLLLGMALAFLACSTPKRSKELVLLTTTSVQDSGLLDELLPVFEKKNKVKVKVIAVGTGEALRLARDGNGDVVLAHAPKLEKAFVDSGFGLSRTPIMRNDFVIVGPKEDPAAIRGEKSATAAFGKIALQKQAFISRGDQSGTHMKERELWALAGYLEEPQEVWHVKSGSGMAMTLRITNERRAYTLSDRASYIAHKKELEIELLAEGDSLLENVYSVIPVSPKRRPEAKESAAGKFADFLRRGEGRTLIQAFGTQQYKEPLFTPVE